MMGDQSTAVRTIGLGLAACAAALLFVVLHKLLRWACARQLRFEHREIRQAAFITWTRRLRPHNPELSARDWGNAERVLFRYPGAPWKS
jgi:hypothetical protein